MKTSNLISVHGCLINIKGKKQACNLLYSVSEMTKFRTLWVGQCLQVLMVGESCFSSSKPDNLCNKILCTSVWLQSLEWIVAMAPPTYHLASYRRTQTNVGFFPLVSLLYASHFWISYCSTPVCNEIIIIAYIIDTMWCICWCWY